MRIALGSDHAGFEMKQALEAFLDAMHIPYEDFGCSSPASVDYPDIAAAVANCVARAGADRGILVCGTGIGMAIAANKVPGIRASVACSEEAVKLARGHNDLNVLTLGARITEPARAVSIVQAFIETPFDGGRHQRRVDKIAALEARE